MQAKIAATLYGQALGDAFGMPSELWSRRKVQAYFGELTTFEDGPAENDVACNYKAGQFTDDTGQAFVLLDSLIATKFVPDAQDIAQRLLNWAEKENAFEQNILGPTSKVALKAFANGTEATDFTDKSVSNGSAMRIAPIGCLFTPKEATELAEFVYQVTKVTHTSDVTIAGAAMIAMGVSSALVNSDFEQVFADMLAMEDIARPLGAETFTPSLAQRMRLGRELALNYQGQAEKFLTAIYETIGATVLITESVPAAAAIAYFAKEPAYCAYLCANLGGDTDTIGAMATAICGAFCGVVPAELTQTLQRVNSLDFAKYSTALTQAREARR